ncbi:MAG: alpha/beta hydrolase [Micropruina sp.]|uniref:alpha/beta fold hydrolase n=1 Tax=Micropruina sp. TaxID=2737536 RepID=UPI0039E2FED4
MTTSPASVLFISGAGLPAWTWDDVRYRLSDHRTRVAPRPGNGAGLRDYAQAALDAVSTDRFSIVAHSAGGVVAAEVARLASGRVDGVLAVSAIVPTPGGSFLSALPIPNRWILGIAMRLAGTRPPESAIRGTLAHGIDEATVDRIVADFTPEPLGYYRDRTGRDDWPGRREYLCTTADKELPPALQRKFAGRLGATLVHELATGHLPMLEDPAGVVRAVTGLLETQPCATAADR